MFFLCLQIFFFFVGVCFLCLVFVVQGVYREFRSSNNRWARFFHFSFFSSHFYMLVSFDLSVVCGDGGVPTARVSVILAGLDIFFLVKSTSK